MREVGVTSKPIYLTWPIVCRPLHDASLKDYLDTATSFGNHRKGPNGLEMDESCFTGRENRYEFQVACSEVMRLTAEIGLRRLTHEHRCRPLLTGQNNVCIASANC